MRLDRVQIRNFRSVQELTLSLEPRCRVLVGINEAGKTNILRALALLSPDTKIEADDRREASPHEGLPKESFVRFIFSLDRSERLEICERALRKVHSSDPSRPIISEGGNDLTVAQWCAKITEVLYIADIIDNTRGVVCWAFPGTQAIVPGWCMPAKVCPDTATLTSITGQPRPAKSFSLLHEADCGAVNASYLEPASLDRVQSLVHSAATAYAQEYLPECVFWRHSDEHLIPARINRDRFAVDPSTCLPLRHAFKLADVNDIPMAFADAQRSSNGIRNLLDRVAKRTTRYIHDVWPEYRYLKLDLNQNGDSIDTSISDVHNHYNLSRRSDGFKRFIAFLLMISAPSKTKSLTNVLVLHDDSDTGMHPSSARHLRDELIRVSRENYVVYSTHSIFMIDRDNIGRHMIVRKQKEITCASEANESNSLDEEVLYNALGFSFAEILKPKNLVFEGWKDKTLFRMALTRIPQQFPRLKGAFEEVGSCQVCGVKDVRRVTPLMELAGRQCWIVSDGDRPAREQQAEHKRNKLYGEWIRYDELLTNFKPVTAEDFFRIDYIKTVLKAVSNERGQLQDAPEFLPERDFGLLREVDTYLTKAGLGSEDRKDFIHRVKDLLFDGAKPSVLRHEYYEFLAGLAERIKSTTLEAEHGAVEQGDSADQSLPED